MVTALPQRLAEAEILERLKAPERLKKREGRHTSATGATPEEIERSRQLGRWVLAHAIGALRHTLRPWSDHADEIAADLETHLRGTARLLPRWRSRSAHRPLLEQQTLLRIRQGLLDRHVMHVVMKPADPAENLREHIEGAVVRALRGECRTPKGAAVRIAVELLAASGHHVSKRWLRGLAEKRAGSTSRR